MGKGVVGVGRREEGDCLVNNHMDMAAARDNTTLDKREEPEGAAAAAAAAAPTTSAINDATYVTVNIARDATQLPSAETLHTGRHLLVQVSGSNCDFTATEGRSKGLIKTTHQTESSKE